MTNGKGRLSPEEIETLRREILRLSRIDELQNQALGRNLREREELKLDGLLQALRRIEDGSYGLCVECGAGIDLDRLSVFPETATSVGCAA